MIDASRYGNISRLYNHSCEPNIAPYTVLTESHEESRHGLSFFCLRNIEAGEELVFDYSGCMSGVTPKSSVAVSENADRCMCGTVSCRGFVPLF